MTEAPAAPAPNASSETPPATPPPAEQKPSKADLPPELQAVVDKERAESRAATKRAEAAEKRAKEFEDKDKSDLEKATERAAAAEKRAADLELASTRLRVAAKHGLDPDLADRLRGDTEAEIDADAKALAERFGTGSRQQQNGSGDQGSRGRAPGGASDSPNAVMNDILIGRRR